MATTAFDLSGEWELDNAGTVTDMIVVFHPTDLYPYSIRYKNSSDTYLAPFQMRRKAITFQPDHKNPYTAHLWMRRKLLQTLPPLTLPQPPILNFPKFGLMFPVVVGFSAQPKEGCSNLSLGNFRLWSTHP